MLLFPFKIEKYSIIGIISNTKFNSDMIADITSTTVSLEQVIKYRKNMKISSPYFADLLFGTNNNENIVSAADVIIFNNNLK
jgi:hypothetical protein